MNILLAPISQIFRATIAARRALYENEILKSKSLNAPVFSVGNITVGGTGKTPLVKFVASFLSEQNQRVCILTRGYKRAEPNRRVVVSDGERILAGARAGGDEPFELARQLLGAAAVVADKNRFAAGTWARENLGATAFVLDDGFQHWQLHRNLDIVTVDASNPFGNRKLLPAGILREHLASLKRADAVVVTRSDLIAETSTLQTEIKKYNSLSPILLARTEIRKIRRLTDFSDFPAAKNVQDSSFEPKSKVFAFCAIGNPRAFVQDLKKAEINVVGAEHFPDHHSFKQTDIAKVEKKAVECGAEVLLTTTKDAGKLKDLKFNLPCFVSEAEMTFEDAEPLLNLLKNSLRKGFQNK